MRRYQLNAPFVVAQVLDGEAILINFDTGAYYSAGRAGAGVLQDLEGHQTVDQIIDGLTGAHGERREDVAAAVEHFISELQREGLIVPLAAEVQDARAVPPRAASTTGFEPPRLQKFDDLQDILLLDPIHDGDQPAWPVDKAPHHGGSSEGDS